MYIRYIDDLISKQERQNYQEYIKLFNSCNFDDIIVKLINIEKESTLYTILAYSYFCKKDIDNCKKYLKYAIEYDNSDQQKYKYAKKAELAKFNGDIELMKNYIDKALLEDDNYTFGYFLHIEYLNIIKEYDKAIELSKKILNVSPSNLNILGIYASSLYSKKMYKESLAILDKAIKQNSQYEYAITLRADLYKDIKEYKKAIADYTTIIQIDDKEIYSLQQRALSYKAINDHLNAIEDYKKLWIMNNTSEYLTNEAISYKEDEKYEVALLYLNAQLKLEPDNEYALTQKAMLYYNTNQYNIAIDIFSDIIKLDSSDGFALGMRGICYSRLNQNLNAISDLKNTLNMDTPEDPIKAFEWGVHKEMFLEELFLIGDDNE
jgi:tetratricopeptide (TPR) repeat protein